MDASLGVEEVFFNFYGMETVLGLACIGSRKSSFRSMFKEC